MQIFFVIVAISAFVGGMITNSLSANRVVQTNAESQSAGASFRIFANAVARFMAANPLFTGPVDLALIPVPAWFNGQAQFSVIIEGGRGFVYVVPGSAGLSLSSMFGSPAGLPLTMGIVKNQLLNTIPVPSAVPEGALVYIL